MREKVESRYVPGDDQYKISNAKEVVVEEIKAKKNFGGSGGTLLLVVAAVVAVEARL